MPTATGFPALIRAFELALTVPGHFGFVAGELPPLVHTRAAYFDEFQFSPFATVSTTLMGLVGAQTLLHQMIAESV